MAERITLYGAGNLAEPSQQWADRVRAEHPGAPRAQLAEQLRTKSAHVARVDGAIAGTPFLIAFVPAYMAYLWQEGRMVLRTAALYGRDPSELTTSAETLVLRGVHPSVEVALAELEKVRDTPMPGKPEARRPLKVWVSAIYALMIFGGFLSAPSGERARGAKARLKATAGLVIVTVIWVSTWVFPVTFMILMAWGCESHARELGNRALAFYGGDADSAEDAIIKADRSEDRGHDRRTIIRTLLLGLSVVVPLGIVAGVIHLMKDSGSALLTGIGAVVACSLVVAVGVAASRD